MTTKSKARKPSQKQATVPADMRAKLLKKAMENRAKNAVESEIQHLEYLVTSGQDEKTTESLQLSIDQLKSLQQS